MGAFAGPLAEIRQAAGQVRQNVHDANWLVYGAMLLVGVVLGLFAGYLSMRGSVNALEEHVYPLRPVPCRPASTGASSGRSRRASSSSQRKS